MYKLRDSAGRNEEILQTLAEDRNYDEIADLLRQVGLKSAAQEMEEEGSISDRDWDKLPGLLAKKGIDLSEEYGL
jgi:hypothetical protein